jgi:RNA polymerase sigma factor (sigma-70 family)
MSISAAIPMFEKILKMLMVVYNARHTRFVTLSRPAVSRVMTSMDRPSELALVARLRAGDSDAFDEVHAAFNTRLFNFLARLARRREVAEDLLEETWLRFVARAPKLREDTQLGPFLFTVARNLHVSYCRSRLIEDHHSIAMLGLWPSGTRQPSPLEWTTASETTQRIEKALASLPAIYREALLLVGFEGMQAAEAAAICGVSAETMRQRISRARSQLAERLQDEGNAGFLALKEVIA